MVRSQMATRGCKKVWNFPGSQDETGFYPVIFKRFFISVKSGLGNKLEKGIRRVGINRDCKGPEVLPPTEDSDVAEDNVVGITGLSSSLVRCRK